MDRTRDLASLAGCIYREKSVESSSVTADPPAIGQIGHRPAHLQGTRANDSKGALAIAHGRLARYTQILHNANHVFVERLASEFNAVALAIERTGHELNLLSRGEADVRRKLYGRSSLNGGGQLVGGSNRYGLTGLCNASIARLLAFGAVFGILCLDSISLVLPKRSCERAIFGRRPFSLRFICRNAEGSFGWPGRPFAFGRPSVFGRLRAFGSNSVVSIVDFIGGLLRLRLGFCGNYRIKDRLIRWKTTSRLITHVCPNKQWRTGMRENGERERAVEDDPHGFWHRFGRATRRHNKDAICRAFRPVGVKLEHGALDDFAHHSIRFGDIPEISSWQKRFLDSQGTKHAPKVTIVGAPLATPDARTTAAKNAARRIPSKASMPTSPQPPRRKSERLKHYSKKDLNSKGSDLGIRPNHTQRLFSRQISSKRWHLQKAEAHTLLKNLE